MKTAARENPNRCTILSSNRAHGAVGQNRSCSIKWAAKQEKFRPAEKCFLLTSTFIELGRIRTKFGCGNLSRLVQPFLVRPCLPAVLEPHAWRPVPGKVRTTSTGEGQGSNR